MMILLIQLKPKHQGAKRLAGETSRGELTTGRYIHKPSVTGTCTVRLHLIITSLLVNPHYLNETSLYQNYSHYITDRFSINKCTNIVFL